jgi:hypothetical protein
VNEPTHLQRVVGYTGYAVYINALVQELGIQGHSSDFQSIPWSNGGGRLHGHKVLHDVAFGDALYQKCGQYDVVIIHATTPLPERFIDLCQYGTVFSLVIIVHDTVFCNPTYGCTFNQSIPVSRWSEEYLFNDTKHITEIIRLYAPNIVQMADVYRMFRAYIALFNESVTICPSPQVATLLASFGVAPDHLRTIPHAIPPLMRKNGNRTEQQVISVMSWQKMDLCMTMWIASYFSNRQFHLICSDTMRNRLLYTRLPSNVILSGIMSREDFFNYINAHEIGLCLHLTRAFETFALLPYEMSQLGVRTTMPDNESGLTQAIRFNHLEQFSVGYDYNMQEVMTALRQPLTLWNNEQIAPFMRMDAYTKAIMPNV